MKIVGFIGLFFVQTPLDKSSIQKSPSLGLIAQTERRKSTSNERSDSEDGGEEKWLLFQVLKEYKKSLFSSLSDVAVDLDLLSKL